ncbi:MAG TPA: RHS repeat-associated core domain-containing protein [Terriglobales bacterium]|nr:RHS repeat-associated core domain-containing protein [Terriglobales bacterium]
MGALLIGDASETIARYKRLGISVVFQVNGAPVIVVPRRDKLDENANGGRGQKAIGPYHLGSGAAVARYSQGLNIDQPLAQLRSGATSYYEQDGIGSVSALSNSAGVMAGTYTYDSFGKLTASSGTLANPFQYTGREFDQETGLYYYRARYYDESAGRFLSEDPMRFGAGPNFYPYANNSPTNAIDPTGTSAVPVPIPGLEPVPVPWAWCYESPVTWLACLDAGLVIYDAYQLYGLGQAYGWWNDFLSSGNMQQVHNPNRAKCQRDCQPCVPPVGSLRYRLDQVPPSRPHKPWPGTHWDIEQMQQRPAPDCGCLWKEIANGQGDIPPGVPPVTP